jgi:hypothetical protein
MVSSPLDKTFSGCCHKHALVVVFIDLHLQP